MIIWLILAGTGLVSILVSLSPWGVFGATVYMSLPLTIPLFAWRFDWSGRRFASESENR